MNEKKAKRINKTAKGNRIQNMVRKELEEEGYLVQVAIRQVIRNKFNKVIFCRKIDYLKLFDIIALHPEGTELLFIQAKANRVNNEVRDAIRKLKVPQGVKKWVWIWKDRTGWIKEYYK